MEFKIACVVKSIKVKKYIEIDAKWEFIVNWMYLRLHLYKIIDI